MAEAAPLILFGAFDRHNFGDLLIAHVAAAFLAPRPVVFAGLAERDLSAWGGHRARAITALAREWGDTPADVLHVGGEILTCSLYEAAVMLQPPERVPGLIARYDGDATLRRAWARAELGIDQELGYLVPRHLFRRPGRFFYHAVGGANLATMPAEMQAQVLTHLGEAAGVSVRDRVTLDWLMNQGVDAALAADAGVLVAELFRPHIAERTQAGALRQVLERFPAGYAALQFSAAFGDDTTLRTLAAEIDYLSAETDLGIVLFRAGAAPWHDEDAVYRRLAGFLARAHAMRFDSIHLWDICALLANAQAYCGSSLHGRIVAEAFARPAVNVVLAAEARRPTKQAAYASTWTSRWRHVVGDTSDLAVRVRTALELDPTALTAHAQALATRARTELSGLCRCLPG